MIPEARQLTSRHREILAALADVIAPRTEKMPSASDIGLCEAPMDRVLTARRDLLEPLIHLLGSVENEPPAAAVRRLSQEGGVDFSTLMQVVAGAYYLDERVRRAIGYPGQQARPLSAGPETANTID